MADEHTTIPSNEATDDVTSEANGASTTAPPPPDQLPENPAPQAAAENYEERLERLGGEPAPVITPEEFKRLQNAGQVHIDSRGRVRTARREDDDGGVSLRKRRAWYTV